MAFPTAEILREQPPVPGAEAMPGLPAAVAAAPALPPSVTAGMESMRHGAEMRQEAVRGGLARLEDLDQRRAEESERHRATSDPLQAQMNALAAHPLPAPAAPNELPLPPSLEVRPFLTGTPGEPAERSLERAVMGLSLLAQMGFGAAAGVPELSLRALAGAMEGWQAGDMIRGDREFKAWQGTVDTLQRDYQNRRQLVEDIVTRNRGDVERTRIALLTELARHGASQQELQALTESAQAYFALLDTQGKVVQDLGKGEAELSLGVIARQMDATRVEIARAAEGRKATLMQQGNDLLAQMLGQGAASPEGGALGGPSGTKFDPVLSVGPAGPTVRFEPSKVSETAQEKLRGYDAILGAVHDLKTGFSNAELQAYTGALNRPQHEVKRFLSTLPGAGRLRDERFSQYTALLARLTGTAFNEAGKQMTPFEYNIVAGYTPTGYEAGGATEIRAKLDSLERYTRVRRDLTAHYATRGVDPRTVPAEKWDAELQVGLQRAGAPAIRGTAGATPTLSAAQRAALKAKGYTDAQIEAAYGQ
jgi:hypothetical protein